MCDDAAKVALDLSKLNRALLRLQQGLAEARNAPGDDLRRDGVNQRFGCSYELSVKMLRRYIELTSASPGSVDAMGFPDLIRTAAEQGLLSGGWPAWRDYHAARGTRAIPSTPIRRTPSLRSFPRSSRKRGTCSRDSARGRHGRDRPDGDGARDRA
ncbi:MAG: nucleotidyltransferase substrate binding protein [Alphaproteobacteria bacterium]|nr:nucleotidyltransferase substrate binding protein [Alphaproteobacteria bacterium]